MSAAGGSTGRDNRRDALALALVVLAFVAVVAYWAPRSLWTPDALAYQAKVLEIQGSPTDEARDAVWSGPLAAGFRPGSRWIEFFSQGFDRRVVVPALAALVDPLAEDDSLELVAVLGAFAFALLLYVLLRQRFGPWPSAVAAGLCLAWPPMRWAFLPLTESWGLALVTLALLAALLFVERGGGWLYVWIGAVLTLGFTRDLTPIPILAAAALLLVLRAPRPAALAVTGLIAALPAPLLGGAPFRESLAFTFNGNQVPEDSSWGAVLDGYLPALGDAIRDSVDTLFLAHPPYLESWPLLPFTLPLLVGLIVVVIARPSSPRDPFLIVMRGALLGAVVTLALLPTFSFLRRELVLLPSAAAGVALVLTLASHRVPKASHAGQPLAGRP